MLDYFHLWLKWVAEELFSKKDESLKLPTKTDPTLAGVGGVLESVRNKFETKEEEEPIPLSDLITSKYFSGIFIGTQNIKNFSNAMVHFWKNPIYPR